MHGLIRLFSPGSASRLVRAPILLLAIALSISMMPAGAFQTSPSSTPSPGAPEVIARGTSSSDARAVAWRVSAHPVDPENDAGAGAPGFIVAGDLPLVVEVQDGDEASIDISATEASLIPDGPYRVTALDADATYMTMGLMPASTGTPTPVAGPDALVTSAPFTHPDGERALELWRATLSSADQIWTLPDSEAQIALLVTTGAIELTQPDGDEPVTLVAGEAGIADGGAAIRARGSADAVVYAARIGNRVAPGVTPTATITLMPTVSDQAPASTSPTATTPPTPTSAPSPTTVPTPSPTPEAADSDGDGLTDEQEKSLRTNPYSNDSDLDGVFDGYEVANGYNPLSPDTDNDGVSDYDEIANESGPEPGSGDADADGLTDGYEGQVSLTDPYDADSDDDGLNDGDEIAFGSNPLVADSDQDGLNDGAEAFYSTNPNKTDSDGDFLWDAEEVRIGLNPASADTDGDGLSDGSETDTSPFLWDTDGDGLGDGEEISVYGTNPLDYDTDNDCDSDGQEIANGTNPFQGVVYEGFECTDP